MRTVEIPGGTAELRDRLDIKIRHRRMIEAAAVAASAAMAKLPDNIPAEQLKQTEVETLSLTRQEATTLFELQDATIVASLASWTLDEPLPNLDTIGDLEQDVYDALALATSEVGANVAAPENFDASPDPESPTQPSDDTDGVSRDSGESSSDEETTRSSDDGESTDTDVSIQD
jgi:hypothetical protein